MPARMLIKVEGIVDTTIEVKKKKYKSMKYDYELRIFLQDTNEYFRLTGNYNYPAFKDQVSGGDKATIWIRPKWLVPLGMGYRNDIFQMLVNDKIVFDISKRKRNSGKIIIACLVFIPVVIFLGKYYSRKSSAQA
ncbi:MAG: hypothetical protein JNM88_18380 [Chitinophagaceae bacterium]|nr:hypothetical protein [Chitinophagaceae bacterium]